MSFGFASCFSGQRVPSPEVSLEAQLWEAKDASGVVGQKIKMSQAVEELNEAQLNYEVEKS